MNRIILAALLATGVAASAQAQTYQDSGGTVVPGVVPIQPGVGPLFTSANPGKISGSFSASLSGFQPTPSYTSLSVGASSTRVALPTGTVVVVYNTGSNAAYVQLGSSSVVATSGNDVIPAGGWMAFTVGSATYLASIETAGATTLNLSGGSGLPTGAGGGGGSGGGGSNASVGSTGSAVPGSATLGGMSVGGTMTALPGTANGLKVDGSAVTQPVSASSLPLPTGAATSANQTAAQSVTGGAVPASAVLGGMSVGGTMTAVPGTSNGLKVDGSAVTQPVSASALPPPTGAATAANQPGINGDGGALAHVTNFPATQPVSATSLPLPTGAATAANQTNASAKTQIVDGAGNVIASTSNNLNVQCANCSGSGASAADEATMTPGSSVFAPQGGFFQTVPTNNPLTNLQQGMAQLTAYRAVHMNLRNSTGTEIGTASSPLQVSLANTGSNSTAITVANPTAGSTGATAPTSAALIGGRAQNAEATPVANGQMAGAAMGLEGKLITLPFANKENMVRGTASQTGTSATTLIAAQGPGVKIYITGVQCKNTGSATTIVTLNDNETTGSGTVLIVPTSGGDNEVYQTPLALAANTALTFTPSAASSTIYCNAQGYSGS